MGGQHCLVEKDLAAINDHVRIWERITTFDGGVVNLLKVFDERRRRYRRLVLWQRLVLFDTKRHCLLEKFQAQLHHTLFIADKLFEVLVSKVFGKLEHRLLFEFMCLFEQRKARRHIHCRTNVVVAQSYQSWKLKHVRRNARMKHEQGRKLVKCNVVAVDKFQHYAQRFRRDVLFRQIHMGHLKMSLVPLALFLGQIGKLWRSCFEHRYMPNQRFARCCDEIYITQCWNVQHILVCQ
mmetsp:Transcript_2281/g.3281  ORF Transcript_2281/g.3281 Transcript_2281/m.3281 type:complete len:237 (+) Transcript_2281:637-1347(+)